MSSYFLYHSIGTFPGKAQQMGAALGRFSDLWSAEDDGQWPAAMAERQAFLEAWARLIDAPSASLTLTENVTSGLYSLIGALPRARLQGKKLLVAADCFPSLHFLLAGLAPELGFTLETVPLRQGSTWVEDEDFIARWDESVGLALITQVTSTTSHRVDVARMVQHGHAMGSLVGVDITQGVGVVPFSLTQVAADFVVSSSLKWLCGASGAGILYCSPALLLDCAPLLRGWFSQENPFSWDLDKFQFAKDIRRFDHGTPAILAAVASRPGIEWVLAQGVQAIAADNAAKTRKIIALANEQGLRLVSPMAEAERGGSVMLNLPAACDPTAVVAQLRAQAIYCDARGAILRLSPGIVTADEAIDALFAALSCLPK